MRRYKVSLFKELTMKSSPELGPDIFGYSEVS